MKMYVDCDDTLILWKPSGEMTWKGDAYTLNLPLIRAINMTLEKCPYELVVWSGGGKDYAERWARKCFPKRDWTAEAKGLQGPQGDDVVIDDMDIVVGVKVYKPDEFIEFVDNWLREDANVRDSG